MREIENLGVRGTGSIDKRYGTEHTATYCIFECPVCLKHYTLIRSKGERRNTCHDCKGTQATKHGMAGTKIYSVWNQMHQRCSNPNNSKFPIYGGKGIKVCDAWQTFEGFWADVKDLYQEGLTIDRPDSTTDYSLDTTRWIPQRQNSSETTKRRPVIQLRQVLLPEKHYVEVARWESARQAGESLGLVPAHISATCAEKRQTHGGFKWQYVV
jgi:hypothetical protein